MKVHILFNPPGEALSQLQAILDDPIELTWGEDLPDPPEVDVLVAGRPTTEQIQSIPSLTTLVIPFSGIPPETREVMQQFPHVDIYNLHHNATATAEMAVGLMFSAAKRLIPADRDLRSGNWTSRYEPSRTMILAGKNAVVLGYGAVGKEVARLCLGIGMQVTAVRRQSVASNHETAITLVSLDQITTLLPHADVLFLTVPLTEKTAGLIDRAALRLLPQTAILINVSRGGVVEERDLYEALQSEQIRAAGIDVWWNYPTDEESRMHTWPSEYPFWELDNVVLSPHRGGGSEDRESLRMSHLAPVLNQLASGDVPESRVDLRQGY